MFGQQVDYYYPASPPVSQKYYSIFLNSHHYHQIIPMFLPLETLHCGLCHLEYF